MSHDYAMPMGGPNSPTSERSIDSGDGTNSNNVNKNETRRGIVDTATGDEDGFGMSVDPKEDSKRVTNEGRAELFAEERSKEVDGTSVQEDGDQVLVADKEKVDCHEYPSAPVKIDQMYVAFSSLCKPSLPLYDHLHTIVALCCCKTFVVLLGYLFLPRQFSKNHMSRYTSLYVIVDGG